jgi:hypothetical protein
MPPNYPQRAGPVSETLSDEEARVILRLAAEPYGPQDNKKSLIAKAAKALSLTYSRAKRLWYAEDDSPLRAEEAARLRAEQERLYQERLQRLRREIAETERLLLAARHRADVALAQAKMERAEAADRAAVGADGQTVLRVTWDGML